MNFIHKHKHILLLISFILIIATFITLLTLLHVKEQSVNVQCNHDLSNYEQLVDPPVVELITVDFCNKQQNEMIAAIGTDKEQDVFGYNLTYYLLVATQEGGSTAEDAAGIVQATYNSIKQHEREEGVTYTPFDICFTDKYCPPAKYVSYYVKEAFINVFILGDMYTEYGNATMFYNPRLLGRTNDEHEKHEFIYETTSGVRFFEVR